MFVIDHSHVAELKQAHWTVDNEAVWVSIVISRWCTLSSNQTIPGYILEAFQTPPIASQSSSMRRSTCGSTCKYLVDSVSSLARNGRTFFISPGGSQTRPTSADYYDFLRHLVEFVVTALERRG
jgi:hypothetical protein